jgi:hypothetical protein
MSETRNLSTPCPRIVVSDLAHPHLNYILGEAITSLGGIDKVEALLKQMNDIHPQVVFDNAGMLSGMHRWGEAAFGLLFLEAHRTPTSPPMPAPGNVPAAAVAPTLAPAVSSPEPQGELF